jgi:hypothetical protein
MARKEPIAVVLERASGLSTAEEKAAYLRQNDNTALRIVLKYALDKRVKWLLPKGPAPYKPCPYLDQEGQLYSEARRLYLFVEGGNPNLTDLRREMMFIQILESVHPKDAELLNKIKDKKLPVKGITTKVVNLAFPGLVEDEQVA